MRTNFKKLLLAGTAFVAGSTLLSANVHAQTNRTLTGDAANLAAVPGFVAGDNINLDGFNLNVIDDDTGTAIGDITDTGSTPDGNVTFSATDTDNTNSANTVNSITLGTGNLSVLANETSAGNPDTVTVTVTTNVSANDVTVSSATGANAGDDSTLNVTGNLTAANNLAITSDAGAAAADVDGNVSVTGTATLTSSATQNATLNVGGNLTTGGVVLDDSAGSSAILTFDNTTTVQQVSGAIAGSGASEGEVVVSGIGATFADDVGDMTNVLTSVLVNGGNATNSVIFQDDLHATNGLVFGDAGDDADAYNITFGSTSENTAVTGVINTTAASTDVLTLNFLGGNTIATAGAIGAAGGLDDLNVTGSGTILDAAAAITSTDIDIGAGATIQAAGTLTGAVSLEGASANVTLEAAADVVGAVDNTSGSDGVGVLVSSGAGESNVSGAIGGTNSLASITVDDAGEFSTNSTVAATTITATGASTLDFAGTVTGNINLQGAATVEQATGTNITGNVDNTSGADGNGTLALEGVNQVTGTIGATNSLTAVTLAGANAKTFDGTVNADAITFGAAGTANFNAHVTSSGGIDLMNNNAIVALADNVNVTGNISSTGGANGVLNFAGTSMVTGQVGLAAGTAIADVNVNGANETVTITGDSFMGTFDTVAMSTAVFQGDLSAAGNFTNAGTTEFASGSTVAINADNASSGTITFNVSNDGMGALVAADITSAAGGEDLSAATFHFQAEAGGNGIITGEIEDVFTAGGAIVAPTITDSSFLYNFALGATLEGNDVDIDVSLANSVASATTNPTTSGSAAVIEDFLDGTVTTTDNDLQAFLTDVANAGSADAANETIEAVLPALDGATTAAIDASAQSLSVINGRLASVRGGNGVASGDTFMGGQAWVQGFGSTGEQDERDGVDGYDVDAYGVAVGIDGNITEETKVGIAFAYAETEVDSDDAANTETDIDSYLITIYGEHEIDNVTYVNGHIGYGFSENDVTRTSPSSRSFDYDSDQYSASVEVGRSYAVAKNTIVTPSVGLSYLHYDADDYTDPVAGGVAVDTDSLNKFEGIVGAELEHQVENADGSVFAPYVSAEFGYDFIGDEVEATTSFVGGGSSFNTEGFDSQDERLNLGAGFTFFSNSNWEVSADYEYEYREDFDSNSGRIKAAINF